MATKPNARRIWRSVYVWISEDVDAFLEEIVSPISSECRSRRLRFFFLRYDDPTRHIRLRFYVSPSELGTLTDTLKERMRILGFSARMTVEEYDRTVLYFGENMASVYAELLNTKSSALALSILHTYSSSFGRRFLGVLLVLRRVAVHFEDSTAGNIELIGETLKASTLILESLGAACPAAQSFARSASVTTLVRASERQLSGSIGPGQCFQDFVRLLVRTARLPLAGIKVVCHALHLLCNKVGLTIGQEVLGLQLLAELTNPSSTRDPL